MKKIILAILLLTFWASSAEATTWYVRKGGLDANGCTNAQTDTDKTALLTINAALTCARNAGGAGNTVTVHVGTYVESIDSASASFPYGGSWGSPFTLQAYTGETVTIKTNSNNFNLRIFSDNPLYAIVQGFIFDGATLLGTESAGQVYFGSSVNGGNYIIFQNNELINNDKAHGIGISRFTNNLQITNNKIHGGLWEDPQYTSGAANTYPVYHSGSSSLFVGNEIYDFTAHALQLYSGYSSTDVHDNIVRNNYIHDFGSDPAKSGGWAILIQDGSNNKVYNNIVANSLYGAGIALSSACVSCVAYNNTVYSAAYKGFNTQGSTNAIVKNNIDRSNGASTLTGTGTVASNNLTADPSFVSTNSADATFLNLSASSTNAIDQGVDVSLPYNGTAPDIGAFETFTVASSGAEIGLVDNSTIDLTFQSTGQPYLPASGITSTAWTSTCGTVSTVTRTSDTHMHVNLAAPYGGGGNCAVSYSTSTGNVTNTSGIPGLNQRLNAITSFTVTDNTKGGGGPTLAYVSGQFYLLQGATDSAWVAKGAADANITVAPGSKLWWRFKVQNTGAATSLNPRAYINYDGGSDAPLTNSFVNAVKALGTGTQVGTVITQGASITQDVLASTYGNVTCTATRDASAQPTLALGNNNESECAVAIEFDTSAQAGKIYIPKIYTDTGTLIGGSQTITIGNYGGSR